MLCTRDLSSSDELSTTKVGRYACGSANITTKLFRHAVVIDLGARVGKLRVRHQFMATFNTHTDIVSFN